MLTLTPCSIHASQAVRPCRYGTSLLGNRGCSRGTSFCWNCEILLLSQASADHSLQGGAAAGVLSRCSSSGVWENKPLLGTQMPLTEQVRAEVTRCPTPHAERSHCVAGCPSQQAHRRRQHCCALRPCSSLDRPPSTGLPRLWRRQGPQRGVQGEHGIASVTCRGSDKRCSWSIPALTWRAAVEACRVLRPS